MAAETLQEMMDRIMSNITLLEDTPQEYKCETCKDKGGWTEIRQADVFGNGQYIRDEQVWVECSCAKQRRMNRLVQSSRITEDFQKMQFSNFDGKGLEKEIIDMAKLAKKYADNYKEIKNTNANSISLLGQPGCGKTHLLTAVSNNLIKQSIPVLYFPFISMMSEIQKDNFSSKDKIIEEAKNIEILFIDDLYKPVNGKPQASDWNQSIMYDIVNYRYLNKKPILLSCELDYGQLLALDEATGSRLFEMSQDYVEQIPKDFRKNFRTRKLFNKGENK